MTNSPTETTLLLNRIREQEQALADLAIERRRDTLSIGQYFDRVSEPGELQITVLDIARNEGGGGDKPGLPRVAGELLNVVKSSPNKGTIKVAVNPTEDLQVGDGIKVKAALSAPGGNFEEIFLIKITDPEKKQKEKAKGNEDRDPTLGLPELILVYKDEGKGPITWDKLEEQGISIDHEVVMHPYVPGDALTEIYVNMDSRVLLNHRSRLSTEEAIAIGERRYVSAVYFHTLFLYMITKNRKYEVVRRGGEGENDDPVDLTEYLKDLFQSYYAEFLLNFEVSELVAAFE